MLKRICAVVIAILIAVTVLSGCRELGIGGGEPEICYER